MARAQRSLPPVNLFTKTYPNLLRASEKRHIPTWFAIQPYLIVSCASPKRSLLRVASLLSPHGSLALRAQLRVWGLPSCESPTRPATYHSVDPIYHSMFLHASERRNLGNPTRVNGAHGATLTAWGCIGLQYQWRVGDAQLHHNVNRLHDGGRLRCARAIPPPPQPLPTTPLQPMHLPPPI